jgi:hypothetical protein
MPGLGHWSKTNYALYPIIGFIKPTPLQESRELVRARVMRQQRSRSGPSETLNAPLYRKV